MFIILFLLLNSLLFPAEKFTIDEALHLGLIEVSVTAYTDTSEHEMNMGRTLFLELTALDRPLRIELRPGTFFASQDTGVQDQILIEERVLSLLPGKSIGLPLFTMCTQKYNAAPSVGDQFRVNGLASAEMTGLADFLAEKGYQNNEGQAAMWMLTDAESYENIVGQDEKAVNEIRKFMAGMTERQIPLYRPEVIESGSMIRKLSMVFRVRLKKSGTGKLVLYHPDGTVYRVLKEEGEMPAGRYEITFRAESSNLQPGNYTAVLHMNGMILQQEIYRVR